MLFCVEDDDDIRELMLYALSAAGFEAEGFSDGAELMRAIDGGVKTAGRGSLRECPGEQ